MNMNIKKIVIIVSVLIVISCHSLFAIGYNVNFELDAGISECLFGEQVKENKNFWQDIGNFGNFINAGGAVTVDLVFTHNLSAVTGIQFKSIQLNYEVIDGNEYGNDSIHLKYPVLQIPIMAKYRFILNKTTEIIDSIDVAAGINLSYIIAKQSYKDSLTTAMGNFISIPFNVGLSASAVFSHKIGIGKAYVGLKADMNFIPQGYSIGGRNVKFGNVLTASPVIGYTFLLKEDKGLAKITEKNKRIKDIDVN